MECKSLRVKCFFLFVVVVVFLSKIINTAILLGRKIIYLFIYLHVKK